MNLFWTILGHASKFTDRKIFLPFHLAIRAWGLFFAFPIYNFALKLKFQRSHAFTRHSVSEPFRYHALYSDIDLSLVIPEDLKKDQIKELIHFHQTIRGIYPPFGEIEIYRENEIKEKQALNQGLTPLERAFFDLIWDLRKYKWQLKALAQAKSSYHADKARRSMDHLRKKWGAERHWGEAIDAVFVRFFVSEMNRDFFGKMGSMPSPFYSSYLEWTSEKSSAPNDRPQNEDNLSISPDFFSVWVCLFPDAAHQIPDHLKELEKARSTEPVRSLYQKLCHHEYLIAQSYGRTHGENEGLDFWKTHLKSEFSKH